MRTAPYLAIAATLILWASSFPAIKAGLDGYSPLSLAALRFAAASLVLGCAAPFLGIRLPQRRHGALVVALGLIGVAGYHILLNYGEALATASAAAFIANAAPLFTTIMAKAMGERVGRRAWLGLLAGLAGVWLIGGSFSARGFFDPGAALLLGAALCWSLFFVLQKPLLTQHSPLEVTCYAVWIGTIALALFLPDAIVELRSASLSATLSALYLGVLPTAGAYLCWAYVLATVPVSQAALYTYLVPVLSAAIAYAWLGEQPSLGFSLGAFSVLLGVVIAHRSRS